MTIKAVVRDGVIQPLAPLPAEWVEGKELLIKEPSLADSEADLDRWEKELDEAAAQIPPEDHERMQRALEKIDRESKDAVRREWGLR
jgi:hypothetical protein